MSRSRRRLLMVTSNAPRWAGDSTTPFVLHLAQDLAALDWDVDILAPHAHGASLVEEFDGVTVRRFRYVRPTSRQTLAYDGGALMNLRASRWAAAQVPFLFAAETAAVRRAVRSARYDLVQSHWVVPQGTAVALAGLGAGTPHVVTVHGSDVLGLGHPALAAVKRWTFRRADAVTVNSSATESAVRELAPAHVRVARIPMGITLDPAPAPRAARAAGGPVVAFVGRLVGWKGVDDLLDAVALIATTDPTVSCLIAGTGPDRDRLVARAAELALSDRVRFLGWVPPAEVPALLRSADVAVFPSRAENDGTTEGQGLAVVEAMASGTPVVATRVGGIPDSLRDGVEGLLVDQRSPAAIAAAVRRLHHDPALASTLSSAARERATTFSRSASAQRFDALFASLARLG